VHAALHWAEPYIAYAFAKVGKTTAVMPDKDDGNPKQALNLGIRDPETGAPWFGPIALSEMMEELAGVLNFLKGNGPGGNFTLHAEGDHLRLEWSLADIVKKDSQQ